MEYKNDICWIFIGCSIFSYKSLKCFIYTSYLISLHAIVKYWFDNKKHKSSLSCRVKDKKHDLFKIIPVGYHVIQIMASRRILVCALSEIVRTMILPDRAGTIGGSSRDEIVSAIGSKWSCEVVDNEEKKLGRRTEKKAYTRYGEGSDNGESLYVACWLVSYHHSNGTKRDCRRYLGTREIVRLYQGAIQR